MKKISVIFPNFGPGLGDFIKFSVLLPSKLTLSTGSFLLEVPTYFSTLNVVGYSYKNFVFDPQEDRTLDALRISDFKLDIVLAYTNCFIVFIFHYLLRYIRLEHS
jgi:hypothetical protein